MYLTVFHLPGFSDHSRRMNGWFSVMMCQVPALINKDRVCNKIATVALIAPLFKAISDSIDMTFSQPVNQNKHGLKICPRPVRKTLAL